MCMKVLKGKPTNIAKRLIPLLLIPFQIEVYNIL